MAAHVEQQGKLCYGLDLRHIDADKEKFTLKYLLDFYRKSDFKDTFFSRRTAAADQVRADRGRNQGFVEEGPGRLQEDAEKVPALY
jgi:hypothetical protein